MILLKVYSDLSHKAYSDLSHEAYSDLSHEAYSDLSHNVETVLCCIYDLNPGPVNMHIS